MGSMGCDIWGRMPSVDCGRKAKVRDNSKVCVCWMVRIAPVAEARRTSQVSHACAGAGVHCARLGTRESRIVYCV